jgi:hypothetical protein
MLPADTEYHNVSFNPVPGKAEVESQSNFEKLVSCLTTQAYFKILIGFKKMR